MSIDIVEIKRIARLAKIGIPDDKIKNYLDINPILELTHQINQINTTSVEPLSHPLEISQRLRPDMVTEVNHRTELQAIAPHNIEAGLYLVPQVLDHPEE